MATSVSFDRKALNFRILSIVIFTFVTYLSIGLPLAVLPGFTHNNLGYSAAIAGVVISIQYFATLISRPQAGRYSDLFGPKKVVIGGLLCSALSGFCYWMADLVSVTPGLCLTLICIGRFILGFGESFGSTGSTLWGIGATGSEHTGLVISWNGVATYGAMALGAPFGVLITDHYGLSSLGITIFVCGVISALYALTKTPVKVQSGPRLSFSKVFSKVWLHGLGLALGTIGFGVIATFITLFYAQQHWQGAATALSLFSLAFVGIRLLFNSYIAKYGALKAAIVSFAFEIVGLLLVWLAISPMMTHLGVFITGGGFSLIFPALGVEAVKRVPVQNQGTALGTYSAFLDCGLGLTGPAAGLIIHHYSMNTIYLVAAVCVFFAVLLTLRLQAYTAIEAHRAEEQTQS